MKIKIKHLGSIVEIDENSTTSVVKYDSGEIVNLVDTMLRSIHYNQPEPPEPPKNDFRDMVKEIVKDLLDEKKERPEIDIRDSMMSRDEFVNAVDELPKRLNQKKIQELIDSIHSSEWSSQPVVNEILRFLNDIKMFLPEIKTKKSVDPEFTVSKKQVTSIHRQANEIKKMLEYWDDHSIVADCGGTVHKRAGDSNTMKVTKSFLNKLITKFPDNENH